MSAPCAYADAPVARGTGMCQVRSRGPQSPGAQGHDLDTVRGLQELGEKSRTCPHREYFPVLGFSRPRSLEQTLWNLPAARPGPPVGKVGGWGETDPRIRPMTAEAAGAG